MFESVSAEEILINQCGIQIRCKRKLKKKQMLEKQNKYEWLPVTDDRPLAAVSSNMNQMISVPGENGFRHALISRPQRSTRNFRKEMLCIN